MNTNFIFKPYFEEIIHEYLNSKNIKQIFPRTHSPYVEIKRSQDNCPKFTDNRDKIKEYKKDSLNDDNMDVVDYSEFQHLSPRSDIINSLNNEFLNFNDNVPVKIQKLYQLIPIFNLFFKYYDEQNKSKYTSFNDYLNYDENCQIKNMELFIDVKVIITRIIRQIKCRNYLLTCFDLKILIYEKIKEKININNISNIDINDEKIFNIWESISAPLSNFFILKSHKSIKSLIFNIIKAECLIKSNNYIINNYELSINRFNLNINHEWLKINIKSLLHDPNVGQRITGEINNNLLSYLKNLCFGLFVDHNLTKKWKNTKMEDTNFFNYACNEIEQKKLLNEDTNFTYNSNNFNPLNNFKFLIIKLINCSIITVELYIGFLINYLKEKAISFDSDKKILYDLRKNDDLNSIHKLIKSDNINYKNETDKEKLIILFPNYLTIIEMKNLFKLLNYYDIIMCFIDNNYLNIETTKFINELIESIPKIPIIELNFEHVYKDYIKKYTYFENYIDSYYFNNIFKKSYENFILYTYKNVYNKEFLFLDTTNKSISLTLYKKTTIIETNQLSEDLKLIKKNNDNDIFKHINNNDMKKLEGILEEKESCFQSLQEDLKNNNNCIILQNFSAKYFMELIILDDLQNKEMYFINFIRFKEKAIVFITDNLSKNDYKILFDNFKHIKIIKFI